MHAALADIELPESIQAELRESQDSEEAVYRAKLDALTKVLLEKRHEAIEGRRQSGIEDIWEYCERAYIGIDKANEHEFNANRWMKPLSTTGGISQMDKRDDGKSTLFIPYTRRYVNAGSAKVQEILLDPDERPFGVKPTPVPELVKQMEDKRQIEVGGMGLERDPTPKEVNPGSGGTPEHPLPLMDAPDVDTAAQPGKPLTYAEVAAEKMRIASEAAEAAAKRMHDQLVEGRFTYHDRRCIQDGARIGTGIIKGPVPDISRGVVATKMTLPSPETGEEQEVLVIEVREEVKPVPFRVSPWNFYPDPGCGEDIQNGAYTWESVDLSRSALQKMAKMDGVSARAIAEVLQEKPKRVTDNESHKHMTASAIEKLPYQGWHFYGTLTKEEYRLIQEDMPSDKRIEVGDELEDVYVMATIVNDKIVQMVPQPNEKTGAYPYQVFTWMHREGFWAGIGVAEQGMPAQRVINSACRRLFDNAGFSAGMQLLIDDDLIEPVPVEGEINDWKIQAIKLWRKKAGAIIDDMRKGMHAIQFPNAQQQLSWIIEFGIRIFEEITNIPLVTQGWSGKTTPDTLGATELQNSNANQMLRDVAMNHDQGVIVPLMAQWYEWHLLDPNVPDEEKGDMKLFARGSGAMLDRYLQRQVYEKHLPLLMQGNRMFDVDPKKLFEEVWRGYRLNPAAIQYTEAQKKELANQPPPESPEVTVAKMRGDIEMKKIEAQHEYNMKELELRREIAQLEYQTQVAKMTSDERKALEANKRSLAETSMELATQKEISLQTATAKQITTPPTEPAGRADAGHAYEQ